MVAIANGVVKAEAAADTNTTAAADCKADSPISVLGDEVIHPQDLPFLDLSIYFSLCFRYWGRCSCFACTVSPSSFDPIA
jgi:hypothetical protein